jgi:hypothetical protein
MPKLCAKIGGETYKFGFNGGVLQEKTLNPTVNDEATAYFIEAYKVTSHNPWQAMSYTIAKDLKYNCPCKCYFNDSMLIWTAGWNRDFFISDKNVSNTVSEYRVYIKIPKFIENWGRPDADTSFMLSEIYSRCDKNIICSTDGDPMHELDTGDDHIARSLLTDWTNYIFDGDRDYYIAFVIELDTTHSNVHLFVPSFKATFYRYTGNYIA